MIRFNCDYLEGAHPRILERLAATNMEQTVGYGCDDHSERARELIKKVCACPTAAVHFLVGGTQANFTVISAALRPYQGVIAADTGTQSGNNRTDFGRIEHFVKTGAFNIQNFTAQW